jgi:DNA-directed RNA polymerase sigma subunit (sigma70/sigma32)
VLRMRYGLDDGQEKTLEEVGAKFKVRKCLRVWSHPS